MRAQTLECRHGLRITKSGSAQTINFKLKRTNQFEKNIKWSLALYCKLLAILIILMHYEVNSNPRRRSEIPGPFWKLFWVTNTITIIKWGQYLLITAKIRNKRWFFSYIFVFDCFELASLIANGKKNLTKCCKVSGRINWLRIRSCSN